MKMSNDVIKKIDNVEEQFIGLAPAHMKYTAEKGYVIQCLSANDYLKGVAEKNPASLLQSVKNVASIGLSLSPAEKLAYLVPRKGKVCLDVSYVGFCRLATNSGSIEWIQAELYYSNGVSVPYMSLMASLHWRSEENFEERIVSPRLQVAIILQP
jgi:recombination protein RecT